MKSPCLHPFRRRNDEEKEKLHRIHEVPISPCIAHKSHIPTLHRHRRKERSIRSFIAEEEKIDSTVPGVIGWTGFYFVYELVCPTVLSQNT